MSEPNNLKLGDLVLWQSDGTSGVGYVTLVDHRDNVAYIRNASHPTQGTDYHLTETKNCQVISEAIAKIYFNSNG